MSEIELRRSHQLSDGELRTIAAAIGDKLVARHGGECHWTEQSMHYQLPGTVTAEVQWNASEILVVLRLQALAAMFENAITAFVAQQLDRYLSA